MKTNHIRNGIKGVTVLFLSVFTLSGLAFDSGSTGTDGAFNPTEDIQLPLPPSGIFNFTTINIPADVTVTFAKNAANTPVVLLASGEVVIDGTIDISGESSASTLDDDVTNDAVPGAGGPGGFDGGHGGYRLSSEPSSNDGGYGQGPGGGNPGVDLGTCSSPPHGQGGGGGGFGSAGADATDNVDGGPVYGSSALIPLLGGSGGGGGAGNVDKFGSAGGGGGGALLIASSATIAVNGTINADGGRSGRTSHSTGNCNSGGGGSGGGGSGGGVRLVATTIEGTGSITAAGGVRGDAFRSVTKGGNGGDGRIRLEAENMSFTAQTTPAFSFAGPSPVFVPDLPTIQITSVAGIAAPASPTGKNDIVLPENTPNPVEVVFATSDIPSGGTITVTATPVTGSATTADSTPIASDGTASAEINLPNGASVLIAQTTFTVTASMGEDFSKYARGEQVEKVKVAVNEEGRSETTFITVSGKEYTWPSNAVAMH